MASVSKVQADWQPSTETPDSLYPSTLTNDEQRPEWPYQAIKYCIMFNWPYLSFFSALLFSYVKIKLV